MKKSVSPRCSVSQGHQGGFITDIFKVLQKIGDSLAFAIGKDGFVESIAGPACTS